MRDANLRFIEDDEQQDVQLSVFGTLYYYRAEIAMAIFLCVVGAFLTVVLAGV